MHNKKGLGKGLAALMGEAKLHYTSFNNQENELAYLHINSIVANQDQPRKQISQEALEELANSISENGILQPILVQKIEGDKYRIIAGERRWRASQIAGLSQIPAIVKTYSNSAEFEIALVENIQRQDLNPMEEASGYERLINEFGYTQEQVAKALSKSRSHIANSLRLNSLPENVKEKIANNQMSMGHAKVIASLANAQEIANIIVDKGFSVRQTENYVKSLNKNVKNNQNSSDTSPNLDNEISALQDQLSQRLGARVSIESGQFGGKIVISYNDFDQLDEILNKIG